MGGRGDRGAGRCAGPGLVDAGARVAVAGRDPDRLAALAADLGGVPAQGLDVVDVESGRAAAREAAQALGGLDAVVVASGVVAFGPAADADDAVVEEVFAVNTLGPMSLVRSALPLLADGGAVVLLSAVVADAPTLHMAEYSASKAALSSWASVLRRELRPAGWRCSTSSRRTWRPGWSTGRWPGHRRSCRPASTGMPSSTRCSRACAPVPRRSCWTRGPGRSSCAEAAHRPRRSRSGAGARWRDRTTLVAWCSPRSCARAKASSSGGCPRSPTRSSPSNPTSST
ncbi:SDR family NAD(P)-dependent oxidoreductase [Klenkia terrae]|uniref:SDR family NAD(P)-dependent oxidoreductase n=1 Tax=Klenkia terrae TaxID=1052259 RepID=UPI0036198B8A